MVTKKDVYRTVGKSLIVTLTALCVFQGSLLADQGVGPSGKSNAEASAKANAESDLAASLQGGQTASKDSGFLSKLQIHGFLSQAYAEAEFVEGRFPAPDGSPAGPTQDELNLGIPESGTTDYRNLALQFRYDISPKDTMIIQLSSRALGESPISTVEDEIELDWAFYERRLLDNTSIKVGRIQIPIGIFNQVRDVGTILPFYRPPFVFYREASFTNETVDGLAISHVFGAATDWSVDSEFYFGEWDELETDPFTSQVVSARIEDSFGFQLWMNTRVSGLRLGLGGQRRHATGGAEGGVRPIGATTSFEDLYVSVDAVFLRWLLRAEAREFENAPSPVPIVGAQAFQATFRQFYVQLGLMPTDKIHLFLQFEQSENESTAEVFSRTGEQTPREDLGIALNYRFSPNVVLKAEHHLVEGEDQRFIPTFTPQGPRPPFTPVITGLDDGSYTIISLSASF